MITILCIVCGKTLRMPDDTWEVDGSKRVLCTSHHDWIVEHIEAMSHPGVAFGGYAVKRGRGMEAHS